MRIFQYISISMIFLIIVFIIYGYAPKYHIIKGEIYGTYYNIKINSDVKNKTLEAKIKAKLQEFDGKMSVFNKESELTKINEASAGQKISLSSDLSEVLQASHKVWRQSEGWFDPTIGDLINLWGFGNINHNFPNDNDIKKKLRHTGFNKIIFENNYQRIYKTTPHVKINLSSIAKGYIVDKIGELLDSQGYGNYIIDIGGEIKVKGYRSKQNDPWNVAVNKPVEKSHDNILILSLSDIAVATSGNYRNYYKKDGKTYAHTISPKNGYPVKNNISSVTVFHDLCMYADAYATAINAMGLPKGIEFAEKYNIKAIIYDTDMKPTYTKSAKTMME